MERNATYSIKELLQYYDVVFFDGSALSGNLNTYRLPNTKEKSVKKAEDHYKSLSFLRHVILENEKNNLLFHKGVLVELERCSKMKYRKRKNRKSGLTPSEQLFREFSKNTSYVVSRGKDLISLLKDEDLLINLTQKERISYGFFSKTFEYLIYKKEYELSAIDLSLIITGAVLAKSRGKTALVSNDFPILKAWRSVLSRNPGLKEIFDFYIRTTFEDFVKK